MVRNSRKMMIFGALIVGLLCIFFINQESLAADITKLSMTFITKTNLTVNQMDRNFSVFTVKNNYGQRVYYAKIKNSEVPGINVIFSPSEVIEFETNMTVTVMMGIYANQSVVNGTYQIRVWAESRDADWNNIKSPNYYINLTIFSNYTIPTTSTTTSTTTSVYTTTTEKSLFGDMNNTFSKTIGKNISKNQILIIVAVIMIVIVIIPTLSFKKEPAGIVAESKEKTNNEEK